MQYTIIAENDISKWQDNTGARYHFPKRYRKILAPGTSLIHYKGRLIDKSFAPLRRSLMPHYFAVSIAGRHYADGDSDKGDQFLDIVDYRILENVVPIRIDGKTIEHIPEKLKRNYWRNGVRAATAAIFQTVAELGGLVVGHVDEGSLDASDDLYTSVLEGASKKVYSTRFERSPALRKRAIRIHGSRCAACEISMAAKYGPLAGNYIQVHHKRPLSLNGGPTLVDPRADLIPLCPNCHAMVHNGRLLTVNELREALGLIAIEHGD
ncbi:HNH endonuclease [Rhizobium leguminosarum]|uniref:HNH endonuclease n=1 Tax=Rhizobium leguminosarum TaxID=384 RepID=UPI0013F1AD29|nr:HNH endonuclease [Rhizobium leguminosarum]